MSEQGGDEVGHSFCVLAVELEDFCLALREIKASGESLLDRLVELRLASRLDRATKLDEGEASLVFRRDVVANANHILAHDGGISQHTAVETHSQVTGRDCFFRLEVI